MGGYLHAVTHGEVCRIVHRLQEDAVGLDIKDEDYCLMEVSASRGIVAEIIALVAVTEAGEVHGVVTIIRHDHAGDGQPENSVQTSRSLILQHSVLKLSRY